MPATRKRNHSGESQGGEDAKKIKVPLSIIASDLAEFTQSKIEAAGSSADTISHLPDRETTADYYQLVPNPIDFTMIQKKIEDDEYESTSDLISDFRRLCDNASQYFKRNSAENKFATELWTGILKIVVDYDIDTDEFPDLDGQRAMLSNRERNTSRESSASRDVRSTRESSLTQGLKIKIESEIVQKRRSATPDIGSDIDIQQACRFLFATLSTASDGSRDTCTMFQLLPSKDRYPEYYLVIKEPIDMKIIAERIKQARYMSLADLQRDFELMVKNAKLFNEPGSQVYKDAMAIQKLVANTVQSIAMGRVNICAKVNGQAAESIVNESAAFEYIEDEALVEEEVVTEEVVQDEIDDNESDFESDVEMAEGNLFVSLYDTVKNFKDESGTPLSEPFVKLPSRKLYPDYFEEIKKPVCLDKIHKRILSGKYTTLSDLERDLHLMFKNAMQYNADESKIFQDAAQLLAVMKAKASELAQYEIQSEYSAQGAIPNAKPASQDKVGATIPTNATPRNSKRTWTYRDHLRRRLVVIYKTLVNYREKERSLISNFMNLPSQHQYPDYYQIILKPIDMQMVKSKIKLYEYKNVSEILEDLNLLFENARQYNEPNSMIYLDAVRLQEVLNKKLATLKDLVPKAGQDRFPTSGRTPKIPPNLDVGTASRMQQLFDAVYLYRDSRDRQLSIPFVKLPSKQDLPDYYEMIRQPIDLQRLKQKIDNNKYNSIEDLMHDFNLVFDNACKYNQPESLIYKDALTLQRVCLQKKSEICEDDNSNTVPNVKAAVQELMTNLFISVFNYEDAEGRCYSDSFTELSESAQYSDRPKAPLTFDQIKRNLDKGRYQRLDRFQQDMFQVFDFARKVSPLGSQLYEDAKVLHLYFVKVRNDLCGSGGRFFSPAQYKDTPQIEEEWEEDRKEKLKMDFTEDEDDPKPKEETAEVSESQPQTDTLSIEQETYSIGDFVYLRPKEKACEPHIVAIKKLWSDADGNHFLCGNLFYRPNETFHPAKKKFLDKEVFLTRIEEEVDFSHVVGRCYVMKVQDYFKMRPNGFNDDDIFVCESRYEHIPRMFKKIKYWKLPDSSIELIVRECPLEPKRVPSIYADDSADDDVDKELADVLDIGRESVVAEKPNAGNTEEEGVVLDPVVEDTSTSGRQTCYEQFVLSTGCFKLGDCVYVRSEAPPAYIARIDKIWTNETGEAFFYGPWFVRPSEIDHLPTRMFYRQELFLSSIADANPLLSVISKCSVLSHRDFCTMRITDVADDDVYICESKYCENEKSIRKLSRGLRKHVLSRAVCHDEVYYFKKPINPEKEPSPLLPSDVSAAYVDQYSLDQRMMQRTPGYDTFAAHSPSTSDFGRLDETRTRKPKKKRSNFSGYILYSGEVRKAVQDQFPEASFGEISRVVGERWRKLTVDDKAKFEGRARDIMDEQRRKDKEAEQAMYRAMAAARPSPAHSTSPAAATPQPQVVQPQYQMVQQPIFITSQGQIVQYPQAQQIVVSGAQGQIMPQQGQVMQQQGQVMQQGQLIQQQGQLVQQQGQLVQQQAQILPQGWLDRYHSAEQFKIRLTYHYHLTALVAMVTIYRKT